MRHARVARWSLGDSVVHRRHAAAKIIATLIFLLSIATLTTHSLLTCILYLILLVIAASLSRLPIFGIARAAGAVLPFALVFALVAMLAGETGRAWMLVVRAYLSAFAAVLLIATTSMPDLIAGFEWLRVPAFLLLVMQFLYRYLIVLMEEAGVMRNAGLSRGGSIRRLQFHQAAAAAGVLFSRSWARATAIHQAMVSRGFDGRIPLFRRRNFRLADALFAAAAAIVIAGLRISLR